MAQQSIEAADVLGLDPLGQRLQQDVQAGRLAPTSGRTPAKSGPSSLGQTSSMLGQNTPISSGFTSRP